MNNIDILLMANKSLWRRKVRTILTIMGVIIGTTAIVIMLSLGFGLTENERQNMARWGSLNIIRVYPGQAWDREGNPIGEAKVLNDEALNQLKRLPGITAISPAFEVYGETSWGRKKGWMPLVGLDPTQLEQLEFTIGHGRLLTGEDRLQIVIGAEVINNFWEDRPMRRTNPNMYEPPPREDPSKLLGERISLTVFNANQEKRIFYFTVVGILDEKNMERAWQAFGPLEDIKKIHEFMQKGNSNNNNMEFYGPAMGKAVPRQSQQAGSKNNNKKQETTYNYFLIRTEDVAKTKELSTALREQGYNASSMADSLEGIERTSRILQAILGGIGSITLLVAALGITNTMIMSIYERTREIGIIKVMGASNSHIRAMFLTEAILIGFIGGLVGLGLSYGGSYIINQVAQSFIGGPGGPGYGGMPTSISLIPPWLALFAVVFATLIGLLAGYFPANRAIKLSPIDAIRQV